MRPLCRLITASAILLWRSTDSATAGSNRTKDASVSFSAVRLATNASVAQGHLRPYSTAKAIEYDHQSDEKRGLSSNLLLAVTDAIDALYIRVSVLQKMHPAHVLERLGKAGMVEEQLYSKLLKWLKYVEQFNSEVRAVEDGEIFELLLMKVQPNDSLVRFLYRLRTITGMKLRADNLQRLLAAKYPKTLEDMKILWLASNMKPEEAYQLMPIAAETRLTGEVTAREEWPTVTAGITSWLKYVTRFNRWYPEDSYDSKSVVAWLVKKRGLDEVVAALDWFRYVSLERKLTESWEKELAATHPQIVEKMMSTWQKSHVGPEKVYKMMPVTAEIRAHGIGDNAKWDAFCLELRQWLDYFEKFISKDPYWKQKEKDIAIIRKDFRRRPEQIVLETLNVHSKVEEVRAFLDYLKADMDLREFAQKIEKLLPAGRTLRPIQYRRVGVVGKA